ncbi:MAG: hypothetical protein WAV90_00455 [Gordonia amarae]
MTAATCANPVSDLDAELHRLKDVTQRLHESQDQTRYMSMERKHLIAALRRRGVTLRTLADAAGVCVQTVWDLSQIEEASA